MRNLKLRHADASTTRVHTYITVIVIIVGPRIVHFGFDFHALLNQGNILLQMGTVFGKLKLTQANSAME